MSYYYDADAGDMNKEEFLAWKAAKNYDDRLVLKFDPVNQDYVIYIKTDMSDGMPRLKRVLGMGRTVPTPDQVVKTLYEADGWKHGDKLLRDMDAREESRKAASKAIRDELSGEAAERIEKVLRDDGKSPVVKSFRK